MPPDSQRGRPTPETASRKTGDAASDTSTRVLPGPVSGRECAWCHGELPPRRRRFCTDECRRKGQKRERIIEDDSYAAGVVRLIRKMGVRASADLEALRWLAGAAEHARGALAAAVDGCRARGYSDTEIGMALGYDKPNARQAVGARFGRRKQAADCSDDRYTGTAESRVAG
jgi:predicted nucleic acid-binding Zn ribbon protein